MPAWSGTVTARILEFFTHRADLWEITCAIPAGEYPSDGSYGVAPVLTAVPAYRRTRSAVDTPELVGLIEGEDLITVDTWRFPAGTALDSSWAIVDRSTNPDGTPGLNYGRVWIAKGDPVRAEDWGGFDSGMVEAFATRLPIVPAEITAYYA